MSSIYDQYLDKNRANFSALSPVSFVERSTEVFGDLPAVITVHGATTGARCATARRAWPRPCARWAWAAARPLLITAFSAGTA